MYNQWHPQTLPWLIYFLGSNNSWATPKFGSKPYIKYHQPSRSKKVFHLAGSQGIAYAPTCPSLTRPLCQLTRGDSRILLICQLKLTCASQDLLTHTVLWPPPTTWRGVYSMAQLYTRCHWRCLAFGDSSTGAGSSALRYKKHRRCSTREPIKNVFGDTGLLSPSLEHRVRRHGFFHVFFRIVIISNWHQWNITASKNKASWFNDRVILQAIC